MRELSSTECLEFLTRHRVGRLGIRDADGVTIVPVGYAYTRGSIVGHSPPGHKLHLMHLWPHVGFEVDEITDTEHWISVLVRGKARQLADPDECLEAREALVRAFDGNVALVTSGHGHAVALADAVLFSILPEEITGRAHGL